MQTRSQTNKSKHTVDVNRSIFQSCPITHSQHQFHTVFDFDESSNAWLQNKNKLGNGSYSYKSTTFRDGITTRSGKVLSSH